MLILCTHQFEPLRKKQNTCQRIARKLFLTQDLARLSTSSQPVSLFRVCLLQYCTGFCTSLRKGEDDIKNKKLLLMKQCHAMLCCAQQLSGVQLCNCMDCSLLGFSVHGDSPGKNNGVGYMAFFRRSSQPRDRIQISCIAG